MLENRLGLSSDSNSRPIVAETLWVDHLELTSFLSKAIKATVEKLLSENFSQIFQSLGQNSTILARLSKNNQTLQHLSQSIAYLKIDFATNSTRDVTQVPYHKSTLVQTLTKSFKHYDGVKN